MKAIYTVLLFVLLSLVISSKLKVRTRGEGLGLDCDASNPCAENLHCVNDRCQVLKEKDTKKYCPELGCRCDIWHYCYEGKFN